jgi:dephospho-CoA kinase
MERQIPLPEKQKWADYVIDNRGELADLEKQVQKVFDELVD